MGRQSTGEGEQDGFQDGGADGFVDGQQDGGADGFQDGGQDGGYDNQGDDGGEGQQQDQDNESKVRTINDLLGNYDSMVGSSGRIRWIQTASTADIRALPTSGGIGVWTVATYQSAIQQAITLYHLFCGKRWTFNYTNWVWDEEDWTWLFNNGSESNRYIQGFSSTGSSVYYWYQYGLEQAMNQWNSEGRPADRRPALLRLPTNEWNYISLLSTSTLQQIRDNWNTAWSDIPARQISWPPPHPG